MRFLILRGVCGTVTYKCFSSQAIVSECSIDFTYHCWISANSTPLRTLARIHIGACKYLQHVWSMTLDITEVNFSLCHVGRPDRQLHAETKYCFQTSLFWSLFFFKVEVRIHFLITIFTVETDNLWTNLRCGRSKSFYHHHWCETSQSRISTKWGEYSRSPLNSILETK